jgi:hypothetical protein
MAQVMRRDDALVVVHHNHPSSRSFSETDINVLTKNVGMKGIYAHGHNGSDYYAEKGDNPLKPATVTAITDSLAKALQAKVNLRELNSKDANELFHHLLWSAMHRLGQVKYAATLAGPTLKIWNAHEEFFTALLETFKL